MTSLDTPDLCKAKCKVSVLRFQRRQLGADLLCPSARLTGSGGCLLGGKP